MDICFSGRESDFTPSPHLVGSAFRNAVGGNPLAVIVPCHRVVGARGNLTGYGGGMERKIALLRLEGVDMSGFFSPKR